MLIENLLLFITTFRNISNKKKKKFVLALCRQPVMGLYGVQLSSLQFYKLEKGRIVKLSSVIRDSEVRVLCCLL
jgi:hypothetical protein